MADGKVVVGVDLDVSKANKEIAKLKKEIESTETSVSEQEAKKSPLITQAGELRQEMAKARAEVEKYRQAWISGVVGADTQQATAQEKLSAIEGEYNKIEAQIKKIDESLLPAYEKLDRMKEEAGGLQQNIDKAAKNTRKMEKATQKADKKMGIFATRLRGILLSAFVFNILSAGFRELTEWVGQTIKTNEEARKAIAKLKGALLTLAQPLVDVVIPAFTTFIDVLTRVVTAAAQVLSAIFGKTVKGSAESAEGLYEETSALEGVGEAADDAALSLASFDEINKLSSTNKSGAAADTIVPDFSELKDIETPKWAEKVSEHMDDISDAAKTIGILVAGWAVTKTFDSTLNTLKSLSSAGKITLGVTLTTAGLTLLFDHFDAMVSDEMSKTSVKSAIRSALETAINGIGGALLVSGVTGAAFGTSLIISMPIAVTATRLVLELSDEQGQAAIENFKKIITGLFSGKDWGEIIGDLTFGKKSKETIWEKIRDVFLSTNLHSNLQSLLIDSFKKLGDESAWSFLRAITTDLGEDETVFDAISKYIMENVAPWFTLEKWVEVIGGNPEAAWVQEWEKIGDGVDTIVGNLFGHGIAKWFTKEQWESVFGENAREAFLEKWQDVIDWFNEFAQEQLEVKWPGLFSKEKWTDVFEGLREALPESVKKALNAAIAHVNRFIDWVNEKLNISWSAKYILGKQIIPAGSIQLVNIPKIPMLAEGAVIPPNREFMAVLGDQKSGTNIETPLETMVQAFRMALQDMGGGQNEAVMVVDDEVFARLVYKLNNKEGKRIGVTLAGGGA